MPSADTPAIRVGSEGQRIAVRNIWLLYLYATDLYRALGPAERIRAEESPEDADVLVARILCREVRARLRAGLTVGYLPRHAALSAIRDRIDFLATWRGSYLEQGKAVCSFSDMGVNTPRNQFVLAGLLTASRRLARRRENSVLARECRVLASEFERRGITRPTGTEPPHEVYGHFDRADRRMVSAARMLCDNALPSFATGNLSVQQPDITDDAHLRHLYERGIRGFYATNLAPQRTVRAEQLTWSGRTDTGTEGLWPVMRTDITIAGSDGRLIIDTKFTTALTQQMAWHPPRLKSGHLYQIYTYVSANDAISRGPATNGLLLYPSTDSAPDVLTSKQIGAHRIGAATIDLTADAATIRRRLFDLVEEFMPVSAATPLHRNHRAERRDVVERCQD